MPNAPAPIEILYSYADADENLLRELDNHLIALQHEGLIAPWHRELISPGINWTEARDQHLDTASIILLLISVDFFAVSDYHYGTEMQRAMERHHAGVTSTKSLFGNYLDSMETPKLGFRIGSNVAASNRHRKSLQLTLPRLGTALRRIHRRQQMEMARKLVCGSITHNLHFPFYL